MPKTMTKDEFFENLAIACENHQRFDAKCSRLCIENHLSLNDGTTETFYCDAVIEATWRMAREGDNTL